MRPCPEIWNDAHLSSRMLIVSSKVFMRCRAQPQMDHSAQPAGYGFYSSNIWLYKIVGARFL